jgi:hypothetical protein
MISSLFSFFKKFRHCKFHIFKKAINQCQICEEILCSQCSHSFGNLNFCPAHANLYENNKWVAVKRATTDSESSEQAIKIYDLKENLWERKSIPSYLVTEYKVNEIKNLIESHITLFCLESDVEYFKV